MKHIISILLLMMALGGCYTQFEVIERPVSRVQYVYTLDYHIYGGTYQQYWIQPYRYTPPRQTTVVIVPINTTSRTEDRIRRISPPPNNIRSSDSTVRTTSTEARRGSGVIRKVEN
jgi:hypothetical protein